MITPQIAVEICMALFCFLCAILTQLSRNDEPERSRYLLVLLELGILLMISDAIAWEYKGMPSVLAFRLIRIANFLVYSTYPLMFMFVARYFSGVLLSHKVQQHPRWIRGMDIICCFHILVIVVSNFTGLLYYFDQANDYHRGDYYFIVAIMGILELIYLAAMIIRYWRELSRYELIALLFFVIMPFGTNLFQFFFYGVSLLEVSSSLCMILFFMFHEVEKSSRLLGQTKRLRTLEETLQEKEARLSDAHVKISISQMQPHFIFNALGSIEQLCRTDPQRAAEATHRFAIYLRSNLNALSSHELKNFDQELNHVRAYVWLEKMRFGEDLDFTEIIEYSSFQLPLLCVQPLVENAIKHGMAGIEEGVLHVTLHAWADVNHYYVSVADNGGGFDPEKQPDDSRLHIGLANVSSRIKNMCNGRLLIESTVGEGSVFTIIIPRKSSAGK